MNKELLLAIEMLEKEKGIDREVLFEAIEKSLVTACSTHLKKPENNERNQKAETFKNVHVEVDRKTCEFKCYAEKKVVEVVKNNIEEISLEEARAINASAAIDDVVNIEIRSTEIGRIAAQNARQVITQKIREQERSNIYSTYSELKGEVVTGIIQRHVNKKITVDIGKTEAILDEKEQIKIDKDNPDSEDTFDEWYKSGERYKFYILDVSNESKGPRITLSRTHPELVKRLFEAEVPEIQEGTVEIMSIAREAGSRTKIAVRSNDPNVDAVGACLGVRSSRINRVVEELRGEKIDVIEWDENPGNFILNALSPAKVVSIFLDPDEEIRAAKVVVPDKQLSLAIGLKGQNARLAARLTGFKIDIKDETRAADAFGFRIEDYLDDDYVEYVDEDEEA